MVRTILGNVPISWRTVCQLPNTSGKITHQIEQLKIIQRCPFGTFAGMVITLAPRFRTRPLSLRYRTKPTTRALT
jgi:hypothetical protein